MFPINWTVERNKNSDWELLWYPRGDFYSTVTKVELKSDNFLDAIKEAKYVLNM
jgi:hypothetical protein